MFGLDIVLVFIYFWIFGFFFLVVNINCFLGDRCEDENECDGDLICCVGCCNFFFGGISMFMCRVMVIYLLVIMCIISICCVMVILFLVIICMSISICWVIVFFIVMIVICSRSIVVLFCLMLISGLGLNCGDNLFFCIGMLFFVFFK